MGFNDRFKQRPYLEQYQRILRWQRALRDVSSSSDVERESDVIYAFFMNCYHLRDWLIESRAVNKRTVDDFFSMNKEMRICRDLCNASKHLMVKSPSFEGEPDIPGDMVTMFREYDPVESYRLGILVDFEKFYVLELASKCIELWTRFLKSNALL